MRWALPYHDHRGRSLSPGHITFRNTLLEAMYHDTDDDASTHCIVVQLAQDEPIPDTVQGKSMWHSCQLDFWGSALKEHRVLYSDLDLASRYVDSAEAIVYLSILLTNLHDRPSRHAMTVRVVEDGQQGTADCFARCSREFLERFDPPLDTGGHERPEVAQFRLVIKDWQLAKGVVRAAEMPSGIDLVMPLSSFKGRKPNLGDHQWEVWFGIVHWAEPRRTRVSYQVLQWFSERAVRRDLLPLALVDAGYLTQVAQVRAELVDWLKSDPSDIRMGLEKLLLADQHGLLMGHPWVQRQVRRLLRARWIHLATAGGLVATGCMGIPDPDLQIGQIRCGDMPPGPTVMFRYPITNRHGILLVENVGPSPLGTVAAHMDTFALSQGDVDGDYYGLLDASDLPTLAEEIKGWQTLQPSVVRPSVRLHSPLSERAKVAQRVLESTGWIGRISNMITRAAAWDSPRAQPAIAWLSNQLQAAVDSIKWSTQLDADLLELADQTIPMLEWLSLMRNDDAFIRSAKSVNDSGTVACLWNRIAEAFQPLQIQSRMQDYRTLMQPTGNPQLDRMLAYMTRVLYCGPIAAAMAIPDKGIRSTAIASVCQDFTGWANGEPWRFRGKMYDGLDPSLQEMALRGVWQLSHERGHAAVWIAYLDKIAAMVAELVPAQLTHKGEIVMADGRVLGAQAAAHALNASRSLRQALGRSCPLGAQPA